MPPAYKHTQVGYVVIGSLGVGIFIMSGIMLLLPQSAFIFVGPTILILSMFIFATLTVEVDATAVRFWFGLGLMRKTIQLREIAHCAPVRIPFPSWGIRYLIGRGWLYNVSGWEAVEIRLHSGRTVLIGTDEPEVLCQAIQRQLVI